ncbi:MAG: 16S rRNA (cytidine(1402)-2'-O)-methyltransferase [Zoogloeaceae bacterium]|nr:16S rRNA (cytidine(1402)-2'-O)-methyltransferase [Zoogloeaceae bacterium]
MSDSPNPLVNMPALYVVATPLGNLGDITLRALEVLKRVDIIAAEDTRHSQRLLDACGVQTRLIALHEHNEQSAATEVIRRLGEGQSVAMITDAGTPAISDPGARAVARVREAGFRVVPVPGPSAAIAALSVAGFDQGGFLFVGFLPAKSGARRAAIEALRAQTPTLVMYESPHRIAESLADLAATLEPTREIVIARELTKLHEQVVRLTLGDALAWLQSDPNHARGEFVLLIEGAPAREGLDLETERVLSLLLAELPLKTAARLASEITRQPRNALYARALELKQG